MLRRSYDGASKGLRRGYEGNQGISTVLYGLSTVLATRCHSGSGASSWEPELRLCSFHPAPFPGLGGLEYLLPIRLQDLVNAAAAVALEVEGDVGVTDLLERRSHFKRHAVFQELAYFGGADFDAGQVEHS